VILVRGTGNVSEWVSELWRCGRADAGMKTREIG